MTSRRPLEALSSRASRDGELDPPRADEALDDNRLVAAAVAGDPGAFRELHRRHLPAIYARLTLMVGPGPERDDLAQQVFLDTYRALPRFRGEARFSTFVNRIAINVACDHLERRRRARRHDAPLEDAVLDRLVSPEASPEARAAQRQELARVFARLEDIKPKKRVAFVLVAVQGMSLEEAGELLEADPETVKQRVLHARKEIAARLAREAAQRNRDEAPR